VSLPCASFFLRARLRFTDWDNAIIRDVEPSGTTFFGTTHQESQKSRPFAKDSG
jgi:hypothetical protein